MFAERTSDFKSESNGAPAQEIKWMFLMPKGTENFCSKAH